MARISRSGLSLHDGCRRSFRNQFLVFITLSASSPRDSLIVLTGTDLLTSNMLYGTIPFLTKQKQAVTDYIKLNGVSFCGNLAASCAFAAAASYVLFPCGSAAAQYAAALAAKKCSLPASHLLIKGIGANWLVNLAVFQASTATTTGSKIAAVWFPVTAFVALGLEHSVANMFTIPLGILSGADIAWADALCQISIVTAGNAVGAGLFVGAAQRYIYKS